MCGKLFALLHLPATGTFDDMRFAIAFIFLCLFAVFSIAVKTKLRREQSPVAALKIGESMPDFELPDVNGKTVKLSETIRGKKIVMVNFWATWCGPCRVEMPTFEKLYSEEKDHGFVILAIAEDEDREKLGKYLEAKPVSFPVLIDKGNALAKKLKINDFPTTILVGGSGKVRQVYEGVESYTQYAVLAALNDPKQQ
jgi:peroxiredoxin